ncbi:MAG: tRNA (guanosine(37)-N1)-methyltransferase TrmD [Verrucomicrobia bacterium]|nr:tRNA (guanosine(37)-N1)-methyltransferase TrmD [Verrucomicrobiota bacterium]
MKIDVISLFPEMFRGPLDESIIQRARNQGKVEIVLTNLRDFTRDRHRTVDDRPFGGGPGMVLKPEPLFEAIESLRSQTSLVVMMTPSGEPYHQQIAESLALSQHIIMVCGHYEGIDARVDTLVDRRLSIGDYVLTNGALPAMVVIDSLVRLIPGVLGDNDSPTDESFSTGLLEYPQYTRPANFRGMEVPEVLLSGNHAEIAQWRKKMALERTRSFRPDLLEKLLNRNTSHESGTTR